MTASFRAFVPSPGNERYQGYELDIRPYSDSRLEDAFTRAMFDEWNTNAGEPFRGVTVDGTPEPGLFPLADEGAPTAAIVDAVRTMLAIAEPAEIRKLRLPLDSNAWRKWSNPEIYANEYGIRLDEIAPTLRNAILRILEVSLSEYGYRKALDCLYVNEFLGRLMWAPKILNAFSYNFTVFGEPSLTEPWGWQITGHHLAMNCVVVGPQMVVSPCFWGAEPNEVDEGPRDGFKMFQAEELGGLALINALPPHLRAAALLYTDPAQPMPPKRQHPADNFHLAGAGRDNRVVPYEGASARDFDPALRAQLLDLIELYHRHLPDGPRAARMTSIASRLDDTWFCWIGGTGPNDPFYYRIQSPLTIIEFDHHAGVFLKNDHPEKFHIHTLIRTPNGNDYGMAWIRNLPATAEGGTD